MFGLVSKKKYEIAKNNEKVMNERRKEVSEKNIELQKEIKSLKESIKDYSEDNKSLKEENKVLEAKKECINRELLQLKNEKRRLTKYGKFLTNCSNCGKMFRLKDIYEKKYVCEKCKKNKEGMVKKDEEK